MKEKYEEGQILLIDKPLTWTSFDVVKKIRNVIGVKKIGHAGTLDPLATGLLIIGTGKFTKKLNDIQGSDKSYEGVFEIGRTTPSYDLETEFDSENDIRQVTPEQLELARQALSGDLLQVPPAHSAVKVGGERAYKKARRKESVRLEPRQVSIYRFDISAENLPEVNFEIDCSKGTYIRSMARDFGEKLGVGAYLKKLVRTKVGSYSLSDAEDLESFIERHK